MTIKKTLYIVLFFLSSFNVSAQIYFAEFPKEDMYKNAFDSTGNKQGEWIEDGIDLMVVYDENNSFLLDRYIQNGFYKDNKKEGTWEIWDIDKNNCKKSLVALPFYIKDSLIYTIFF